MLVAGGISSVLAQPNAELPPTLQIGYQKYGTLPIVKARGNLERRLREGGVKVEWIQFPAGLPMLEALNVGSVQLAETGEAPPIFAQSASPRLVYVATEPPNPSSEAILVPKGSDARSAADLKGRKVAFTKGSNAHYLLVRALQEAGLSYADIEHVTLKPAEARAAFESGSVDAWAVWEPYESATLRATGARVLRDGSGLVKNYEFFLADRGIAEKYPKLLEILKEEIARSDDWAKKDPRAVGELLAKELGMEADTLEAVAKKQNRGLLEIGFGIVEDQQHVADAFSGLGLLAKPIAVKEALLSAQKQPLSK